MKGKKCPICNGRGVLSRPKVKCDFQLSVWEKNKDDFVSVIETLKQNKIPFEIKKRKRRYAIFRPTPLDLLPEEDS